MKKIAIVLAGVTLPLGFAAACTPPAHAAPLPCTAVAGAVVQGGTEVVAVHSSAGATVLASAAYRKSTPLVSGKTNQLGLSRVSFPVPDAGYKVVVRVTVLKGKSRSACSTSFTPSARPIGIINPPPTQQPPPVQGPVTVSCADVNFPAFSQGPYGVFLPSHSYNIQATDTNCLIARAIGTAAQNAYYGGHAWSPHPIVADGFTCVGTVTPTGVGYNWTEPTFCTIPNVTSAKVTFTFAPFSDLSCPATNNRININEANTDCVFATDVANAATYALTPAGYTADGFHCSPGFGASGSNPIEPYQCLTPDGLSYISFSAVYW